MVDIMFAVACPSQRGSSPLGPDLVTKLKPPGVQVLEHTVSSMYIHSPRNGGPVFYFYFYFSPEYSR